MVNKNTDVSSQSFESPVTRAFIENQTFLKRFLTRFLSSSKDIEDVAQESYLKALCAEMQHEISYPKAFLFGIARNEALKEMQKKSQRIKNYLDDIDVPESPASETTFDDSSSAKQRFRALCDSALEMPPRTREALMMCKVQGFSYREIAAHLSISISAVEKHIARGLEICNASVDKAENTDKHSANSCDGMSAISNEQNELYYSDAELAKKVG